MLFALGVIFVFGLGRLTGIYLATISTDIYLHDTYFVVGHFHLTMAASALFGAFAGCYFWFPKMYGRMLDERLGKLHFWATVDHRHGEVVQQPGKVVAMSLVVGLHESLLGRNGATHVPRVTCRARARTPGKVTTEPSS